MAGEQQTEPSGLTDAEREALGPFVWGAWIGVAEGREAEYSRELHAAVTRIKADAYQQGRADLAAKVEALVTRWENGADQWGTCSHEWVSLRELRAILAADPTPQREGHPHDCGCDYCCFGTVAADSTPREDQP